MLETPAGFLEYRKKIPYLESFNWDRCDFLKHGDKIPSIFTDIDTPAGSDINAGLLLVKPDKLYIVCLLKFDNCDDFESILENCVTKKL